MKLYKTQSKKMNKGIEVREVPSSTSIKKCNRTRSFHFRYLEICRAKNLTPLGDIRSKSSSNHILEFFGDKLNVNDWLHIMEALFYDQVLQTLAIKVRKNYNQVLDHLDTEKKCRVYRQRPVIFTKFIFSGVVEAVSNCIEFNKHLKVLSLEGLPLVDQYIEAIAKALSNNESIKEISFQRSALFDKGCETICNTVKYLENVEILNMSECELTTKGAECIADMIKIQKISRYTEGWQKSLRYRDVDPNTIPGLRVIFMARNPSIGDDGIKPIIEVLKEDVWIKSIDMENCGLSDRSANLILDCLEINHHINDFNVRNNPGISKFLMRNLREQLGKDEEEQKLIESLQSQNGGSHTGDPRKDKCTISGLSNQIKTLREKLALETLLRKKAEALNEKLTQQLIAYENQIDIDYNSGLPDGYVVVKHDSLQSIIKERNDFQMLVANVKDCMVETPHMKCVNKTLICLPPHNTPNVSTSNLVEEIADDNLPDYASKEPRKVLKVRKVKSEVKYIDIQPKDASKKKESKSDHEFANEADFNLTNVQLETNIGDSLSKSPTETSNNRSMQKRIEMKRFSISKIDLDDLSISNDGSLVSDTGSTDSDTLRNTDSYQPMKVFIRRSNKLENLSETEDKGYSPLKSPRSLFLGLGDA